MTIPGKWLAVCLLAPWAVGARAEEIPDLTQLSLEELMAIEITSVAKKSQRLSDAAAAVHVLTREDIRRAGVTSLPELLRQVPGVQVARIDGSRYAVSIRGFSNRFSGKLLVLLDGRTLYTPLFAGVYWEAQDTPLEDVERIEVIRGPGGTVWGANAVNGVINIITRSAADSQGGYVEALAGNLEGGARVRYGGALGEAGHFRVYATADDHSQLTNAGGGDAHDAWRQQRAGFRADLPVDEQDAYTLQGDVYRTRADQLEGVSQPAPVPGTFFTPNTADLSGANLLWRWRRAVNAGEDWSLQAYLDHTQLKDAVLDQRIDTLDLEWQHRFQWTTRQEITWGLGYRHSWDELLGSYTISFTTRRRDSALYSAFIQDEITLADDWVMTLGSKLEHNDYTGYEAQPSARLLWRASSEDNYWAAVSRAVQTPSRATRESILNYLVLPGPPPITLGYRGNPDLQSEEVWAYELGYRGQFSPSFNLDATVFYNRYDKLLSREPDPPAFPFITSTYGNLMAGETQGVELAVNWQATPSWRLHASYSYLHMDLRLKPGSRDTLPPTMDEGSAPRHMAQLHSLYALRHDLDLDAYLYYSDALPYLGIDGYTRLDLRLAWRPRRDLELSLTGQNLLDNRHLEYDAVDVLASQVPRSLLGRVVWYF